MDVKSVNAAAMGAINDDSKNGKKEEKEENRHAAHVQVPYNFPAVVAPMVGGLALW